MALCSGSSVEAGAKLQSVLTLATGPTQSKDVGGSGTAQASRVPPSPAPLLPGAPGCVRDSLRMLDCDISDGGLVLGALIHSRLRMGPPLSKRTLGTTGKVLPASSGASPLGMRAPR